MAEVALLVDGLTSARIYGRSGQAQGGIDIVGRRGAETYVYQVRRVASFSAADLRQAVWDFAGPPRTTAPEQEWKSRVFPAGRFVLATGWERGDTAVEDELWRLQEEFRGDLEIDVYDAERLDRLLLGRPSVVRWMFGPQWAAAFCGVEPPPVPPLSDGYVLINDPLESMGVAEVLRRAEHVAAAQPGAAAEMVAPLIEDLRETPFRAYVDQLMVRCCELL
ncbi:MAG TPA: hypothetical protein VLH10_08100, partial [Yinghuangia sp.]|nr:hypothetical protein [Yinghuangia sp.]